MFHGAGNDRMWSVKGHTTARIEAGARGIGATEAPARNAQNSILQRPTLIATCQTANNTEKETRCTEIHMNDSK